MAILFKFRKGTKTQNDSFVGAEAEMTYDTTTKGLRIHDGTTSGGNLVDTVIGFQEPSASNNYTWYRLYSSGWVEQGGQLTTVANSGAQAAFPIEMDNTDYQIQITCKDSPSSYSTGIVTSSATTTSISISTYADSRKCCWEVKGMAA